MSLVLELNDINSKQDFRKLNYSSKIPDNPTEDESKVTRVKRAQNRFL